MESKDCLIIHVPNFRSDVFSNASVFSFASKMFRRSSKKYHNLGHNDISFVPVGSIAISNYLEDNGFSSEIIAYSKKDEEKIIRHISKINPRYIFFILNWTHSIPSFIDAINNVASEVDSKIIAAGVTASFFYEDILRELECVDAVIRGDGDVPSLEIMKHGIEAASNTSYRKDGRLFFKKITHVSNTQLINSLRYSDMSNIFESKSYVKRLSYDFKKTFFFPLGRGCSMNCIGCGGSCYSHSLIGSRKKTTCLSPSKIAEEIAFAKSRGFSRIHLSYDPNPANPDFHLEILKKVKSEKIDVDFVFESWGLPHKKLLDKFSNMNDSNIIEVSPFCGSEHIRKANRGFFFTNNHLLKTLDYIQKKGLIFKSYFSSRLPLENIHDINRTYALNDRIIKNYSNLIESYVSPFTVVIGSIAFMNPTKFDLIIPNTRFKHFYRKRIMDQFAQDILSPVARYTNNINMKINDYRYLALTLGKQNYYTRYER